MFSLQQLTVSFHDGSPLERHRLVMGRMEVAADVIMRGGGRRNLEPVVLKMSAEHDGVYELKVDLRGNLGK